MKTTVTSVAILLATANIVQASTMDLFTDFVGFGDSLSDAGRFGVLQPPSLDGRFSDAPTWMEELGERFEQRGGENFNMALGGATAGPDNTNDPGYLAVDAVTVRDPNDPNDIPLIELRNLTSQISAFDAAGFDDAVGDSPLVAIHIGANDFLQNTPTNEAEAAALFTSTITHISAGILEIAALGPEFDSFVIATQLDGALLPSNQGLSDLERAALTGLSQSYNTALAASMAQLSAATMLNIELFDFGGVFSDIVAEADAAGLNTTGACTDDISAASFNPANQCLVPGSSSDFLFVDAVHPGGFAHERLGAAAIAQFEDRIAPVPLPAGMPLLLVGLGAFAVIRRQT